MRSKYLILLLLVLASSAALGQIVQPPPSSDAQTVKNSPSPHPAQQHGDEGARVFQQNCSRCHNTPESFSPRVSGTIIRHMRVRASLSKHDEEVLLRFFNP